MRGTTAVLGAAQREQQSTLVEDSSGAASKVICAKIGQESRLDLILIHTKFETK